MAATTFSTVASLTTERSFGAVALVTMVQTRSAFYIQFVKKLFGQILVYHLQLGTAHNVT